VTFGAISGVVAGAEPVRAEVSLVVGPEIWIGSWAAAVASLSLLYAFDRRHRANRRRAARRVSPVPMTRDHIVPVAVPTVPAPAAAPGVASETPPRRSIEQLLKRKPGTPAGSPLPLPVPGRESEAPASAEESPLLQRLRERGELVARVAAPLELLVPSATSPMTDEAEESPGQGFEAEADDYAEADQGEADAYEEPDEEAREAAEQLTAPRVAAQCAELREAGWLEAAMRLARDGLARYADEPGALLLELSRATFALGRHEESIDSARDALFVWRCRESVEHLIWILTALHRFEPEDGVSLKRAAQRHPHQPLLRHAAGVYEMSHGSRETAEAELRAALAQNPDAERAAAIERDLIRLLGPPEGRLKSARRRPKRSSCALEDASRWLSASVSGSHRRHSRQAACARHRVSRCSSCWSPSRSRSLQLPPVSHGPRRSCARRTPSSSPTVAW
jgi:tetratricopeptide (TPR) repeat protein